jgi:hypothetical protein
MVSVDGIYIKRMLQFREDLSEEMENVVVRVLRNDEADKRAEIDGNVHYVMHMWAVRKIILLYNPNYYFHYSFPTHPTINSDICAGRLNRKLNTIHIFAGQGDFG